MSSKRKKSSLSVSSVSGSELSDAGRQLELSVSKKQKRSNSSGSSDGSNQSRSRSRSKSRSGSGSDSGTQRSRSGSKSRSGSRAGSRSGSRARSRSSSRHSRSDNKSGTGSDSGTGGSDKKAQSEASKQSGKSGKSGSDGSNRSSGSEKSKKLLKASERKASSKLQSTLSNDSDSDNEEDVPKQKSKKIPKKDKKNDPDMKIINSWRDEFDDGLDSDLIGDDDDRDALEEMTEKQREEELFKRAERREELKKRFEISKKLRLQNKDKPPPSRSPSVSEQSVGSGSGSNSASDKDVSKGEDSESFSFPQGTDSRRKGYEEKHAKKFSALTNLKAAREERERKEKERMEKESKHNKKKKNLSESESGSDLEKIGKSSKNKKMKASDIYSSSSSGGEEQVRRKSSSSSSSSSSVSSISSGESDTERHKSKKVVKRAKNIETREELEKIRLSRFKLDKFVHLPIFKRTVIGCFVRIGIGQNKEKNCPVYRVAEITDVCETAKVYDVMKSRTNIGLRIRHGKQERVFRAQFISNQPFTESEFVKWKQTCEAEHVELPTNQIIAEKVQAIQKALTYRYSSYDVDKILASKEKFSKHPHNYAMYKAKLMKERDQYIDMGNQEEVERLDQKLAEHEERAEELDRKRTSTISTISLINDRNRKNNIIRAEKSIKNEVARIKMEGKVDDPFTRRKTLPVLSMPKSKLIDEEPEMTSELLLKLEEERKKAEEFKKQIQKQREADILPKKQEKKSIAPNATASQDIFNAHDFDIDINVAEMGDSMMPSSIALKPVTTSTPANTGPTKRSLKIEEWKKKRGII